tara:strand:- start:645 stop:1628 length:984 start_codon:yes stop_codon:yes gene_type:complete
MIIKYFELKNLKDKNIYLFYGVNNGLKDEIIKEKFKKNFKGEIINYEEKEILDNKDNFFNLIYTKSFFDNEKLIIINRISEKFLDVIQEILDKELLDVKIVLLTEILEKKSKLRNFFEKDEKLVCTPFYEDTNLTLNRIVNDFFKRKKISLSQETINLLVSRSRGERRNLQNELNKIDNYLIDKGKISLDEINELTNLSENYSVGQLVDSSLSKNTRKTIDIINENNYNDDDCVLIIRTFLYKLKRLKEIKNISIRENVDIAINSYRPTVFWKEKDVLKEHLKIWDTKKIDDLIKKTNDLEILIKKHYSSSLNLICDFLLNISKVSN